MIPLLVEVDVVDLVSIGKVFAKEVSEFILGDSTHLVHQTRKRDDKTFLRRSRGSCWVDIDELGLESLH